MCNPDHLVKVPLFLKINSFQWKQFTFYNGDIQFNDTSSILIKITNISDDSSLLLMYYYTVNTENCLNCLLEADTFI